MERSGAQEAIAEIEEKQTPRLHQSTFFNTKETFPSLELCLQCENFKQELEDKDRSLLQCQIALDTQRKYIEEKMSSRNSEVLGSDTR